jgi:hypothetical protein
MLVCFAPDTHTALCEMWNACGGSRARLPAPTKEVVVPGNEKPWSCRTMAWLL